MQEQAENEDNQHKADLEWIYKYSLPMVKALNLISALFIATVLVAHSIIILTLLKTLKLLDLKEIMTDQAEDLANKIVDEIDSVRQSTRHVMSISFFF